MSYALAYEVPSDERLYRRIKEQLGPAPAAMRLQLVVKTDAGLRHIFVWDSRQEWETFRDEAVRPAVNAVLAEIGVPAPPPPAEEELQVVDVMAR